MSAVLRARPERPSTATRNSSRFRGAIRRFLFVIGLPILLIALWWVLSAGSTNFFAPPLSKIFAAFGPTWLEDGRITADILPSLARLGIGYGVALVLGIGGGLLIGTWGWLRAMTEPVLEFFRAIPPPVLVPVLILLFGIGDGMRVVVIALGCLWPILLNTVQGVRSVDEVLRDTGSVYGLRPLTTLRTVVLRGASPQIFAGARQALSLGVILMVVSEMFAARDGLGFMVVFFQRNFLVAEMWTGILILGLIGVLLSVIFRIVEGIAMKWYYGVRRAERGGN